MAKNVANAVNYCGDVFETQRRLRTHLLDNQKIQNRRARDLAAHMLLSIDDLNDCWSIATSWLREELGCHRVDAGFGLASATEYMPGYAEAKDADHDVPSFGGGTVYNMDPAMQAMWLGTKPVVFADIKQDKRITAYLRNRISGAKTKSKFGSALRTPNGGYGLICADWTEHFVPNQSDLYDCFEQTVSDVLSPIIFVSRQICAVDGTSDMSDRTATLFANIAPSATDGPALDDLTPSEMAVAKLVAQGLSYKEIARIRGRSVSTIDHQLRSIRQKTGVSSTVGLVSLFANFDDFRQ